MVNGNNYLTWYISYLLLHNKLPQTWQLEATLILSLFFFFFLVDQESSGNLARSFALESVTG